MYTVDMPNPQSWDEYFYHEAMVAASNSKCLSRKIGSVIVRDKTIISKGYNGPPRGIQQCDQRWFTDIELVKKAGINENQWLTNRKNYYKEHLEGKCPRYVMGFKSGEGLDICVAGHAERNGIVNSAREGMPKLKGTTMYMTCGIPCTPCLVEIINAGIKEIVVTEIQFYDFSAKYLLYHSKLKYRIFDFIEKENRKKGEYLEDTES